MSEYEKRLKQREAELEVALCFAKAFIEELGKEKALENFCNHTWVLEV